MFAGAFNHHHAQAWTVILTFDYSIITRNVQPGSEECPPAYGNLVEKISQSHCY
jgi:hypothetical protein